MKIDKNIPIPPVQRTNYLGGSAKTEFTNALREMNIGDSIEVEKEKSEIMSTLSRLRKKEIIGNFTIRKVGDFKYRIWKI